MQNLAESERERGTFSFVPPHFKVPHVLAFVSPPLSQTREILQKVQFMGNCAYELAAFSCVEIGTNFDLEIIYILNRFNPQQY